MKKQIKIKAWTVWYKKFHYEWIFKTKEEGIKFHKQWEYDKEFKVVPITITLTK